MSEITEVLNRFEQGANLLRSAAEGIADFDAIPAPGKWSARQILAHVADAEVVWAMRFRQLLAEDNPSMPAWDQEQWNARLDSARRDPAQSLATFLQLRNDNHVLLKGISEADFSRSGTHTVRGVMSGLDLLKLATNHVESHARQIQEMRQPRA